MLCENCHEREAVVKFTQVVGNEKKTLNLCKPCAEKMGFDNPLLDLSKVFGKIIIALLSEHLASKQQEAEDFDESQKKCGVCGLTWSGFRKTGRLGCPDCYNAFFDDLKILIRRLHGTNKHIGGKVQLSVKDNNNDINELRRKLKESVEKEEYEKAAELRDRIRELEKQKGSNE